MSERLDRETRVRTGCLTCRSRRIKCLGGPPVCERCNTTQLNCQWPGSDMELVSRGRKRIRMACLQCRARKVRCSGLLAQGSCERCTLSHDTCEWGREGTAETSPTVVPDTRQAELGDRVELGELIKVYFTTVHHYGFVTFIHEPQFMRLYDRESAPKDLMMAMAACSLRFGLLSSSHNKADDWMNQVLARTSQRLSQGFGAVHLMTVILAHMYEYARGRYTSWWMLTGQATRMMLYLSLHTFDETFPPSSAPRLAPLLHRETIRRLAWSVFFMDSIADAGRHDVSTIKGDTIRNQLPATEDEFLRDANTLTQSLHPISSPLLRPLGISAHLIRTAEIRRRILHFASAFKSTGDTSALASLELELDAVIKSLPPDLNFTRSKLYAVADRLPAFVMLHTLRHNCYIILGRAKILIYARDPALEHLVIQSRRDRIARALPTSGIIREAMNRGAHFDPHVAIQAYVALEILLLEPQRLAPIDPTVVPGSSLFIDAIGPLLDLLRKLAPISRAIASLHVEAAHRLIRCELASCLQPADWDKLHNEHALLGHDEAEFDFRNFRRDLRHELSRPEGESLSAEALINYGCSTTPTSMTSSPQLDAAHTIITNIPSVVPQLDTDSWLNLDFTAELGFDDPFAGLPIGFDDMLRNVGQGSFSGPAEDLRDGAGSNWFEL